MVWDFEKYFVFVHVCENIGVCNYSLIGPKGICGKCIYIYMCVILFHDILMCTNDYQTSVGWGSLSSTPVQMH